MTAAAEPRCTLAVTAATVEAVTASFGRPVKPATLRKWVERGYVRKVGRDLYDADTVIARWRERAAL